MSLSRKLLTAIAGATMVGGVVMDANRTHLFNPAWPPHARFHDALTISLGGLMGASGLYYLHREHRDVRGDLATGALLPALFWTAMGSSFLYPGTAGMQSEFPEKVPRVRGVWIDERFASVGALALTGVGYLRARRELGAPPV